ncbi:MAG: guanylate kinase [Bacilli bacterium]|nr:guanylate kinase [Bacilli bacterium]
MKKGLLIILSGPSGVGKGTLRNSIMRDESLNLVYSISMTTREKRNKEEDGVDYYFVSDAEFQKNIDSGNFLEWAEFVGHRYGTPRDKVESLRSQGYNVFLEIEINGAKQVMEHVREANDDRALTIFLMPPSLDALEERIRRRKTESDDIIKERLEKGKKEMTMTEDYDYVVLNDKIDRASNEIISIIKNKMKEK